MNHRSQVEGDMNNIVQPPKDSVKDDEYTSSCSFRFVRVYKKYFVSCSFLTYGT